MGNKNLGILGNSRRVATVNGGNRHDPSVINRLSNANQSSEFGANPGAPNIEQRVGNIENQMNQVLSLLSQMGAQASPQPQTPSVSEVTETPREVKKARSIVD